MSPWRTSRRREFIGGRHWEEVRSRDRISIRNCRFPVAIPTPDPDSDPNGSSLRANFGPAFHAPGAHPWRMKMAGWLSQPDIPDTDQRGFPRIYWSDPRGSLPARRAQRFALPADACRLDQEPAMRDDAAISPVAALDPAGRHQRRQSSQCPSVSQDSGFAARKFRSRRVRGPRQSPLTSR
jgi:hypothetical protein